MIDGIIKAEGNSRLLRSPASIPDNFADFRAALIAGTLPIDLLYNAAGWEVEGTPINKANFLTDETAALYGLSEGEANVDMAFRRAIIDYSSYMAFCGNVNANMLDAAFGKNNEDRIAGIGMQLAMYSWFKGDSKVTYPYTNLSLYNTLAEIYNHSASLVELLTNTNISSLINASPFAKTFVFTGSDGSNCYSPRTFSNGLGNFVKISDSASNSYTITSGLTNDFFGAWSQAVGSNAMNCVFETPFITASGKILAIEDLIFSHTSEGSSKFEIVDNTGAIVYTNSVDGTYKFITVPMIAGKQYKLRATGVSTANYNSKSTFTVKKVTVLS